jgi:urease accessory protein
MWLASPALPVGGFSYSEGLEARSMPAWPTRRSQRRPLAAATSCSWCRRAPTCRRWRAPSQRLAGAATPSAVAAALNAWVLATRESPRCASRPSRWAARWPTGCASAHAADPRWPLLAAPAPRAHLAGGPGAGRRTQPAPTHETLLLAMAFGWAENMVQAAVKAVPLGQSAGQRMLGAWRRPCPAVVDQALATADDERRPSAPMLAILSARHEAQYSRLFRS